jgi:uncharacterized protein involved in outer membrane biogenesis
MSFHANQVRTLLWRTAVALGSLILLLVLGAALLPSSWWRGLIVHKLASATGRSVSIDAVQLHLFRADPELVVQGLTLGNAEWAASTPMLTIKRFDATLSLKSLLRLHLIFPRVAIDTPVIHLERDASGRANWDFSTVAGRRTAQAAAQPTHIPVIQQLELTAGALSATDRIRKLTFEGQISVEEKQNTADDHALNVHGTGHLNGKPFELRLSGEPLIGVQPTKPYGFNVLVSAADIKLDAHTEILHPFDLAAVHSTFHLSGRDLADVFYITGLALPNTPPYDISGTLLRDNLLFRVDDLRGKLGGSDIGGKVSIDTSRERPKLTAALSSNQLNIADLAAPLGSEATPQQKSGTLSRPAAAPTPRAPTLLLPDADLQVARVRGMDADVQYDAAAVTTAKLPLRKVHFHLRLDNGRITLDPLAFALPEGQFSGTVAIDARAAVPKTSIDMKLENVDLAQFKPQADSPPFVGPLLGRVRLEGTGTSVHKAAATANGDITLVIPKGEMRKSFAELTGINLSPGLGLLITKSEKTTEVRCGVANFHAVDGDLQATSLIIDTTHVLVTGGGHIDLNTEALDLSLRGQPKEVRLLRLRTPILLRGSLLHPQFGVQPGKLAEQAGGAVVLATLLTPVAAMLAFVDGGLAKDANCAALIGQAEQAKDLHKE